MKLGCRTPSCWGVVSRITLDWLSLEWRRRPDGIPITEKSRDDNVIHLNGLYIPHGRKARVLLCCAALPGGLPLRFFRKSRPRRPTNLGRRSGAAPWSASFGWQRFHRLAECRRCRINVWILITMMRTSRRSGHLSRTHQVDGGKAPGDAFLTNRSAYFCSVRYL